MIVVKTRKLGLYLGYRWDVCDEKDHPSGCQDRTWSTAVCGAG